MKIDVTRSGSPELRENQGQENLPTKKMYVLLGLRPPSSFLGHMKQNLNCYLEYL